MNPESDRPNTRSRLPVLTASVETQASSKRGEVAEGELVKPASDHDQGEGAVAPDILAPVARIGARQGAQRQHPCHEA